MGRYNKNLTVEFRIRLAEREMDFLKRLSERRGQSVSQVVRDILAEYRRGYQTIQMLEEIATKEQTIGGDVHGDEQTDFDNQL